MKAYCAAQIFVTILQIHGDYLESICDIEVIDLVWKSAIDITKVHGSHL